MRFLRLVNRSWKIVVFGISVSCVILLITIRIPLNDSPVINYQCLSNRCERQQVTGLGPTSEDSSALLTMCRLTCGNISISLWPYPRYIDWNETRPFIAINYQGMKLPLKYQNNPKLKILWDIFQQRVRRKVPTVDKGAGRVIQLVIEVEDNFNIEDNDDESYKLRVPIQNLNSKTDVMVHLTAHSYFGLRHGLQTLNQLIVFDEREGILWIPSNILIMDRPAFKHRGIFVDTSRNFYPVAAIKRTIDAMSLSKLNIFHWRMTGKHSFPFEFQSHPEMTQYGAYSPQKVYSQRDIEEVVEFARNRGISVIPEIDAPSNVGVAWRKLNLMACWNAKPWTKFCSEPPCGQLDPTKAKVYNVLSSLYEETIELFDYPKLFHMGGHGVSSACWRNSSRIVKWMTQRGWGQTESDFIKLWIHFQENALKEFDDNRHNKTPVIIWSSRLTEEVNSLRALDNNRYIVQWQGSSREQKAIKTLLAQNFRVIVSNSDALHLDCGLGNWISDHPHWCSPFSGWQRIYDNRLENLVGGGMANNLILGAEAVLLSHQTDQHSIDARLWPRVSALAERLWTNPKWDWKGAEQRMINHRHELVANGIAAETLVPEWCRKNPGNCAGQSLY